MSHDFFAPRLKRVRNRFRMPHLSTRRAIAWRPATPRSPRLLLPLPFPIPLLRLRPAAVVLLAFLCAACGESPDCAKYADKLEEFGPVDSSRSTMHSLTKSACESGSIKPEVVKCILAASTRADIDRCSGRDIANEATVKEAPSVRIITRKGFSVPVRAGWEEEQMPGGTSENELFVTGEFDRGGLLVMRTAGAPGGVADDAACLKAAQEWSLAQGTKALSGSVVATPHGPGCQQLLYDPSNRSTVWRLDFGVGAETITVTCLYTSSEDPAPFCREAVDGLKVL